MISCTLGDRNALPALSIFNLQLLSRRRIQPHCLPCRCLRRLCGPLSEHVLWTLRMLCCRRNRCAFLFADPVCEFDAVTVAYAHAHCIFYLNRYSNTDSELKRVSDANSKS